jgi:hypothetical protein
MCQHTQSKTCIFFLTFRPIHAQPAAPIPRTSCLTSKNPVTKNQAQDYQYLLHPSAAAYNAILGEKPINLNISPVLSRSGPYLESPDKILPLTTPLTRIYRANASRKEVIRWTLQSWGIRYVERRSLPNIGSTENLLLLSREDWTKSNKITTLNAYFKDRCQRN